MQSEITKKYDKRAEAVNSLLCVGLDADIAKLPKKFKSLPNPQFEFNKWIIEQTHEYVAAFKPNSAFYEARGNQGIKELKMTMDYLIKNHPTIFTILDAKRADIGNTNSGYVYSIFDWLGFDAMTLHPYLGSEALEPFLSRKDKCSIILAKTSNPGAGEFQDIKISEKETLWEHVANEVVNKWNTNGNLMMVVGATYPDDIAKARKIAGDMTFLVPGVGAQGGEVRDFVKKGINSKGRGLIINSARGIIFSSNPKKEAEKLRNEIRAFS
ncbi:MAG TPA: orotidine-5'-phosphate decarboxylase [Candidatus Paceibacterota bacterium]